MVVLAQTLRHVVAPRSLTHTVLLGCGIASSVLYVATDVLASLRYEGYSYTDQVFSELTAEGSPTRSLMVVSNGIPYTVLVTAMGVGVWKTAKPGLAARVTGAMLVGFAFVGMLGGVVFPMATRGAEATLRNTMHIPATGVMSLCIVVAIGFGSTLLGRRFRYSSYGAIATLLVFGALTSLQGGRIASNQPTPWAGLEERVNIYTTLLWLAILSTALLRDDANVATRRIEALSTTRTQE